MTSSSRDSSLISSQTAFCKQQLFTSLLREPEGLSSNTDLLVRLTPTESFDFLLTKIMTRQMKTSVLATVLVNMVTFLGLRADNVSGESDLFLTNA